MAYRLMQGDEACAEGAIAAGCRFFAGYPITPATDISEVLARRLPQVGGKFIQMEDEIASMAAVIGASVGGAKAMTATSGPGFSLMQENIGYAAMAEIPCVVVDVQRAGPSTGLPTNPSQGDVMQARWGTHGDHPIIVLSPSSVRETFDLTVRAFNMAEKYRTPVILLMDEMIGHLREKVELPPPEKIEIVERVSTSVPPEWYKAYENTPSDVPPMISFGEGYRYHITGLFHDERGFPTQRLDEIDPWIARVFRKIERNLRDILIYETELVEDAEVVVIAYGATARSARHAVKQARQRGDRVGFLRLSTIWPFPERKVEEVAERIHSVIVPEMNLGQLALEVERVVGRRKVIRVCKANGEMVEPREILEAIEGAGRWL
ncbi:MAG: 2-oxoacid:acceptor oxidoreductase subunit alpha [Anaerolineae bacterium]|nr:2-oxoacid:acceptor oxidoreductase subunit alpha [Anaerolineae bacterium]MDH7475485.1 2-oxoacid:acceptor oxidoreductase subunit alpha [Anaerolineae bacterium]